MTTTTVIDHEAGLEHTPDAPSPPGSFLSAERLPLFPYLSPLQRVMLVSDGNLTNLLQARFLEPVGHRVVAQHALDRSDDFDMANGDRADGSFLERQVVLYGLRTFRPYVYAEAVLALSRLPTALVQELQAGDLPLGRLWLKHRLEVFKASLGVRVITDETASRYLGQADTSRLLERVYRVVTAGRVALVIREVFPVALGD